MLKNRHFQILFLVSYWIHCKKIEQPLKGMELQEKQEKWKSKFGSWLEKAWTEQVLINSTCKAIKIISQRKVFCWQRIPESSWMWKDIIDTNIFITSVNGYRKIMRPIKIVGEPLTRIRKWIQFRKIYMIIY